MIKDFMSLKRIWIKRLSLVLASAIIFIALNFLKPQFLSLGYEHQSDNFQKLSLHFSAIYQSDNYQNFLIFIALKYCSDMLVQRNTGPWSLIFYWICKVLFVFYSKNLLFLTLASRIIAVTANSKSYLSISSKKWIKRKSYIGPLLLGDRF